MSDNDSDSNNDSESKSVNNSNSDVDSEKSDNTSEKDNSNDSKTKRSSNFVKFDEKKLVFSTAVEVNLNSKDNQKSDKSGKSFAGVSFGNPKPHLSKQQNLQGIKNINNQLDLLWNNFSSKVPAKPNTKPKDIFYCNKEIENKESNNYDKYFKNKKNKYDNFMLGNCDKKLNTTVFDKQFCFEIPPNKDYCIKKDQEQKRLLQLEKEINLIKEDNEKLKKNVMEVNNKKVNSRSKEKEKTKKKEKKKEEQNKQVEVLLENNFDYTRYKINPKASNMCRIRTVHDLYKNSTAIDKKQPVIFSSNNDLNYVTNKLAYKKSFENNYYNNQKFYTNKDYLNNNENDIEFDKCKLFISSY
jgi:hypothetical protein